MANSVFTQFPQCGKQIQLAPAMDSKVSVLCFTNVWKGHLLHVPTFIASLVCVDCGKVVTRAAPAMTSATKAAFPQ